ncbi:MAG: hypothetical protein LOX97_02545 [Sphingomonas sp.]|nr:hypothetical protein [Sphingomonas sp.]
MSKAQSGLENVTATREPAPGFPPNGCQASVPTLLIDIELILAPVRFTSVKLPAPDWE